MARFRRARLEDLDALIHYGEKFWESTRYYQVDGVPYCPTSVQQMILNLFNGGGYIVVLTDEEDNVKGFGLVAVYPNVWNHALTSAGELAFYIDEGFRGKGTGVQLLTAMEGFARIRGVKYMAMISMEHSMDVGPLYEKLGYVKTETTYTKVL